MDETSFPRGGEISRGFSAASDRKEKGKRLGQALGSDDKDKNKMKDKKQKEKKKKGHQEKRWSEMKRTRQALLESAKEKEQVDEAKKRKKNKRKRDVDSNSTVSQALASDSTTDTSALHIASIAPKKARVLSFKSLTEGTALLAVVKSIKEHDVVLALPNNLLGYVRATEISDVHTQRLKQDAATAPPLKKLLHEGQFVRAVVITVRTEPRHRIELSLREAIVNSSFTSVTFEAGLVLQCSIQSREERGYVVSVGVPRVTAFIPMISSGQSDSDTPWERGSLHWCIVQSIEASSEMHASLTLSADFQRVSQTTFSATSALGFAQLLPGTLVKGRVDKIIRNGLFLRFGGVFGGSVNMFHLEDSSLDFSGLNAKYPPGSKVKARIIALDIGRKLVSLTMRPSSVLLQPPVFKTALGSLVSAARICRIDFGIGLALKLPNDEVGYAHISRLSDVPIAELSEHFKVGEVVRARCIDYSWCDELVSVTLRSSQIDQPLLSYSDVKIGMNVNVRVLKVAKRGAIVALTDTLHGFLPVSQIAEVNVADAQQRVHPGQTLAVRVLAFGKGRHRVLVTSKKSLVEEQELPVISTYSQCAHGTVTLGYVVSVQEFGLIVALWGDVKGLVPIQELGVTLSTGGVDIRTLHRVGEVVRVRILSSNPQEEKLTLSLRLPMSLSSEELSRRQDIYSSFVPGQIYRVRISLVSALGYEVELHHEAAEPSSKKRRKNSGGVISSSSEPTRALGFVPVSQIGDSPIHAESYLRCHNQGDIVDALLVRCRNISEYARPLTFSLKPALCTAAAEGLIPSKIEGVVAGICIWGSVRDITSYGAFIHFLGELTGLVHISVLSDAYTKDPHERVRVGQTVCAYVLAIHSTLTEVGAKSRSSLDLALAPALVPLSDEKHARVAAALVHGLLFALDTSALKECKGAKKGALKLLRRGSFVSGRISQSEDIGLVVALDEPLSALTGFIPRVHLPKHAFHVGDEVRGRVLDFDARKAIVDLTLLPDVLSELLHPPAVESSPHPVGKHEIDPVPRVGGEKKCSVLLVRAPWAVVTSREVISRALAVHVNEVGEVNRLAATRLPLFAQVRVRILDDAEPPSLCVLHAPDRPEVSALKKASRVESVPQILTAVANSAADLRPGQLVTAVIKEVYQTHLVAMVGHVKAYLHISEVDSVDESQLHRTIVDNPTAPPPPLIQHPLSQFKPGLTVEARVLRIEEHSVNSGNLLPLSKVTRKKMKTQRVELSARKLVVEAPNEGREVALQRPRFGTLRKGATVTVWVHEVAAEGLWVHLSSDIRARVFLLDCHNSLEVLRNLRNYYAPGQALRGIVTRVDVAAKEADVSLRALLCEVSSTAPNTLRVGAIIPARVSRVILGEGVIVQLFAHTYARIHLCDLSDSFDSNILDGWQLLAQQRALLNVSVLSVNRDDKGHVLIDVSARESLLNPSKYQQNSPPDWQKAVDDVRTISPGDLVQGYVKAVDSKTVWVSLSRSIVARVFPSNLKDKYVKNITHRFPPGKAVRGRVLTVRDDADIRRIELSLKPSSLKPRVSFAELIVGSHVTGRVKSVPDFGVFVTIDGTSGVVGLAHISEAHDDFIRNAATLQRLYAIGDRVRAIILRKNNEKKQLSLSLKSAHFGSHQVAGNDESGRSVDADSFDSSSNERESFESDEAVHSDSDSEDEDADAKALVFAESESDEEDQSKQVSVNPSEHIRQLKRNRETEVLSSKTDRDEIQQPSRKRAKTDVADFGSGGLASGSLDWNAALGLSKPHESTRVESSSSSIDEEEPTKKPKSLLQTGTHVNEMSTTEEFERSILANPQASSLWIAYMAHFLSRGLAEKAREVAERALQRIDPSNEEEKRNAFIAYLHLEHKYGEPTRLKNVLTRALQYCSPKPILRAAITMHSSAGEHSRADELSKSLLSKHGSSLSVWVFRAQVILQRGKSDVDQDIRALLSRALSALPQRKHVMAIAKFSQLSYRFSRVELGRAMFEDLLATYSRRLDLWTLYLDQEERLLESNSSDIAEVTRVRSLYERVTALRIRPVRKMKGMFKRFLGFESRYGDSSRLQAVKERAARYVQEDDEPEEGE